MSGGRWQAWRVLGIERTDDRGAIRRAYADRLRAMDPDADPDAYQDLRDARDAALAWAKTATDGALADEPADPAPGPRDGVALPGLPDLPIVAPLIDRDVAAPVSTGPRSPPPASRIGYGNGDSGDGEDIALPTTGSFATPIVDRPAEARPVTILTNDAVVGAYDLYRDILLPGPDLAGYALSDDERMAALLAIDRFILDPRLEQLEFRDHASQWVAAVAADAIPRSDPLLYRLAQLFGWREVAGSLNEPTAIARINERLDALDFVSTVSNPAHELNRAWRELTTPATERSRRGFVRRTKVAELLTEVRQRHPEVEGWFDSYRVGLWENRVTGPGSSWWIIMLVILAIRLLALAGENSSPDVSPTDPSYIATNSNDPALPPAPGAVPQPVAGLSEPLSDVDRNLTSSLLTLGNGFDVDLAKRENPGLYRELAALWRKIKDRDGRLTDLDEAVRAYVDARLDRASFAAPLPLATELARNSLAQGEYVKRSAGEDACGAYFNPKVPSPSLSPDLVRQRARLQVRAVFEVPPGKLPAEASYRFSIPGPLVAEVEEKLDWTPERMRAAFDRSGPAADICRAELTLRNVAVAKPGRYPTVLRHL